MSCINKRNYTETCNSTQMHVVMGGTDCTCELNQTRLTVCGYTVREEMQLRGTPIATVQIYERDGESI